MHLGLTPFSLRLAIRRGERSAGGLAKGDTSVTGLAAPHDTSLTAVAKHHRVLEGAGLVTRNKRGRVMWCRLKPGPFEGAAEWLAHYQRFWEKSLDGLADYFDW